jgi:1,4-dihydroxy-2-naphthoate octaprenyltransferase
MSDGLARSKNMRPLLGIISVLSFLVGAITFLVAKTMMGQTSGLVIIVLGMVCAIGVAVLNAVERQGVETRRLLTRVPE